MEKYVPGMELASDDIVIKTNAAELSRISESLGSRNMFLVGVLESIRRDRAVVAAQGRENLVTNTVDQAFHVQDEMITNMRLDVAISKLLPAEIHSQ